MWPFKRFLYSHPIGITMIVKATNWDCSNPNFYVWIFMWSWLFQIYILNSKTAKKRSYISNIWILCSHGFRFLRPGPMKRVLYDQHLSPIPRTLCSTINWVDYVTILLNSYVKYNQYSQPWWCSRGSEPPGTSVSQIKMVIWPIKKIQIPTLGVQISSGPVSLR